MTASLRRSLVRELANEKSDPAIVSAIIKMAHSLGLRVLAEGLETEEQLQLLSSLGCDEAQGYLLAKPMPAAELEQLLSRASSLAEAV